MLTCDSTVYSASYHVKSCPTRWQQPLNKDNSPRPSLPSLDLHADLRLRPAYVIVLAVYIHIYHDDVTDDPRESGTLIRLKP
jgi:hypothetical protein